MRSAFAFLCLVFLINSAAAEPREWTDQSGKFKVTGEFVVVRNDKVVIEKTNGDIISVVITKLSAADQEFIKSQTKPSPAPSVAKSETSSTPASSADFASLPAAVTNIFKTSCYRCHGEDGASEGGFNFALNLPKLVQTLVKPKNAAASQLYQRLTATDDSAMPPVGEEPRPSEKEIATIKAWIDAGAPAPSQEEKREYITNEQIAKYVADDVAKAEGRSRRYLRYFTLTHLYNAGVSEDELQSYRNALVKLINSLSWNTSLLSPKALDPQRTIFGIDMRDLHWNVSMWEQVQEANPYFLPLGTREAKSASEETQCKMPYIRADWFVFAASKPPLYHTMLGLPESDTELENLLRVNAAANIDQDQAIRAGFNRSGVSQNNRLIEWHKSPYGSYWKSYDFGGNAGRQNLFEYPLGPGNESGEFQHDGGELIFTLPNGLQGYLLVDGAGRRIDSGPTNIVSDPKQADKTVVNGVSCMSCHYTGVIPKTDEVGPAVRAKPKAYENAEDILALYREPQELAKVLQEDAARFASAMEKLEIRSLSRSGEPISAMAQRFEEELDIRLVACEFGLSVDEFLKRLDGSDTMSRRFAALRSPGGVSKRDVFASGFGEAAVALKICSEANLAVDSPAPSVASRSSSSRTSSSRALSSSGKPGEIGRIMGVERGARAIAFSPNGALLAVGQTTGGVSLFNVSTQGPVNALNGRGLSFTLDATCAFTPDGSRLLVAANRGAINVYEVSKDGQLKDAGEFPGHTRDVGCIAVSSDGRFALSGGKDHIARYWDIEERTEIASFPGFDGEIKACYLARTGRIGIVTDGSRLLELSLGKKCEVKRERRLADSWASANSVAISPNGDYVAVGDGSKLRIWDLDALRESPIIDSGEISWCMTFTPDSTRLLTGGREKVNVWDMRKRTLAYTQSVAESSYVKVLAASPDNQHAAVATRRDILLFKLPGK